MALLCEAAGRFYVDRGYTLVTGNARGSDQAFALGGNVVPERVELCLPWLGYEKEAIVEGNVIRTLTSATKLHRDLAERCHPAWGQLSDGTRKLMVRNAMIVVGVSLVVCVPNWSKPGLGGTGHGMRIARELGIPVWILELGKRFW